MITKQEDNIPWYAEFEFECLDEFLKWKIKQTIIPFEKFIFRGHSKSSYKLLPSALRKDEKYQCPQILKFHPTNISHNLSALTWGNIIEAENNLISIFYKEANKQGLFVPANQNIFNNYLMKYYNEYFDHLKIWYDKDMREVAALAQHYGIPTQMLDWTFNINVAFYFALEGVVKNLYVKENVEDTFTIWGINAENILSNYEDFNGGFHCPIKFYVPNYSGNNHIKTQKGLLTYKEFTDFQSQRYNHYVEEPFDTIFLDYFERINSKCRNIMGDGIQIFKMIFPTKKAVLEFESLSKDGYNAASIYADYEGIIKKLKEDEWIRKLLN